MVCVFLNHELIVTKFNRPVNLKGLTGFKKQTELYLCKCRSESPTLSTFSFNHLTNSNVKVRTICLGLWCYWFIIRRLYKIVKWQQQRHTFSILVNLHLTSNFICCISRCPKKTLHRESNFSQQLALLRSLSPGSLVESEYLHFAAM